MVQICQLRAQVIEPTFSAVASALAASSPPAARQGSLAYSAGSRRSIGRLPPSPRPSRSACLIRDRPSCAPGISKSLGNSRCQTMRATTELQNTKNLSKAYLPSIFGEVGRSRDRDRLLSTGFCTRPQQCTQNGRNVATLRFLPRGALSLPHVLLRVPPCFAS